MARPIVRLTRDEATHAVNDLFCLSVDNTLLPFEGTGRFDNDASGQSTSPVFVEGQRAWAQHLAALVFPTWTPAGPSQTGCGQYGCDGAVLTWALSKGPLRVRFAISGWLLD